MNETFVFSCLLFLASGALKSLAQLQKAFSISKATSMWCNEMLLILFIHSLLLLFGFLFIFGTQYVRVRPFSLCFFLVILSPS